MKTTTMHHYYHLINMGIALFVVKHVSKSVEICSKLFF